MLSVENSSLPVKISENNYVPTDKAEPRLHGFGLQNIAHIMQKYGYEYTLFYPRRTISFCLNSVIKVQLGTFFDSWEQIHCERIVKMLF